MFVGEAPGFHEDKQGYPFVGQAGQAARQAARRDRAGALRGLHRERPQMPSAREPRPAAGRDRGLRAPPLPPDRADPADASSRRSATSPRSSSRASRPGSRACTARSRRSRSAANRVLLYPLYHPAAALYTPAMLKVLEEDFAASRQLMGRAVRAVSGAPRSPSRRRRRSRRSSSACSSRRLAAWSWSRPRPRRPRRSARALAAELRAGRRRHVSGELGAGKTTFVRGACRALGVDGAGDEPDLHDRPSLQGRVDVSHLDLYRFAGVSAAEWGDLEPYFDDAVVLRRVARGRRRRASRRRAGPSSARPTPAITSTAEITCERIMLILAFDTATDAATSALVWDGEVLGELTSRAGHRARGSRRAAPPRRRP